MKKKDFKMPKYYFVFKIDRIVITQDNGEKVTTENVLYKTIKFVNMLGMASFYFKGARQFYVLFFKNFVAEDAMKWFKVLAMYKEKHSDARNDIKKIDIGENFGVLNWEFTDVAYNFNYGQEVGDKKDVSSGFNPDIKEIWISEDEGDGKAK